MINLFKPITQTVPAKYIEVTTKTIQSTINYEELVSVKEDIGRMLYRFNGRRNDKIKLLAMQAYASYRIALFERAYKKQHS